MVAIIAGTNRPDSNTRKVAGQIQEIYSSVGAETKLLNLAKLPPEIFHPGSYENKPESFGEFTETVLSSQGLVVVTPEYNGGMPGILKYFIDMLPFPESFENRPVCFVGTAAGMWGALRPVEQLQAVFGYRNAHIFPGRVFVPGVFKLIGDDGKINDEDLVARLTKQANGFTEFVSRF